MPAEPLKIVLRGGDADCGIVAIAMFADKSYADVMAAACQFNPKVASEGLTKHIVRRTMAALGQPVRFTKRIDWNDDYGLLWCWHGASRQGHLTVLREGLVIEAAATWCGVWGLDEYVKAKNYRVEGIFLVRD